MARIGTAWAIAGAMAAVAIGGGAGSAHAQSAAGPDAGDPDAVRGLLACRSTPAAADRLACFDRESQRLDQAVAAKDVLVVDRAQVAKVRRSVFGFSAADPVPFAKRADDIPDVFEGTVTAVAAARGGRYRLQVDDTVWELLEAGAFQSPPKTGEAVVIKRGLLNSYRVSVAGRSGLRAVRLR